MSMNKDLHCCMMMLVFFYYFLTTGTTILEQEHLAPEPGQCPKQFISIV